MNVREMRDLRFSLQQIVEGYEQRAAEEHRGIAPYETGAYNSAKQKIRSLDSEIAKLESRPEYNPGNLAIRSFDSLQGPLGRSRNGITPNDESRALAAYIRGDRSALQDLEPSKDDFEVKITLPSILESRAVDSTMNITTAADGLNTVPTGFAGMIAARKSEIRIADKLGVRRVPGKGTSVEFPFENADPNQFAATSEQNDAHGNNYERDAAVFGKKTFTLAKKTKKLELTEELLDDEDANLMTYIADHIGRAIALTHNSMLLTEVASNGTSIKTFASAGAIAAGEAEDIAYNDTVGFYLDEAGSVGWVMRPSTFGSIKSITGNARMYESQTLGSGNRNLLEYPVEYSTAAGAIGAEAKSVYFGNWHYVGMREDPALRLIRDPYSVDGLVILKYSFRAVYGVLIAGAIGYGVHPVGSA